MMRSLIFIVQFDIELIEERNLIIFLDEFTLLLDFNIHY